MTPQLVSLAVLVAMFVVATLYPINLGLMAFAAAFVVGALLLGMSVDDIVAGFPGDMFITLGGITFLFGIAQANGTVDLIISSAIRLVRGRLWAVVWLMFALAATLMALGSIMAVAMVAPIALGIAARHRIDPLLMGFMVVHGALGAGFSPLSVYGAFVNGMIAKTDLPHSPLLLFLIPFALNLAFALVLFLTLGRPLLRSSTGSVPLEKDTSDGATGGGRTPRALLFQRAATLLGLVALFVGAAGFGVDVGFAAICIGVVLVLMAPRSYADILDRVSWSTITLVCGMMTYMAVLDSAGTIDMAGEAVAGLGVPLVAALLLCYVGGVVSAFGSSIGTLGITLPLAMPLLLTGEVGAIGLVAALAACATIVDVSPFSTNGAMVLANAQVEDRDRFYRRMVAYSGLVVGLAPLLVWGAAVVPGTL
ncbi:SLC13 family permease [Marinactinospora thermotolerans]|uniref:Transporter, UIT1 family n=1 Tax=Marinactinospora thermotolerans DSM 45154 TaxID=1122192 RepID=A0A1T4SLN2_9ACTN|nr:SLC13 family permease [Marinactinospora thermotolerans]SKA29063.1 transporter, UIT1 family [Marinactinospora thermotolerans DSM 45154]